MKELNALIQEIVDFGDVLSFTDNPADQNFQDACSLFNGYLDWRFSEVKQQLQVASATDRALWSSSEIDTLSQLITTPVNTTATHISWARDLLQYCVELQRNKPIAA